MELRDALAVLAGLVLLPCLSGPDLSCPFQYFHRRVHVEDALPRTGSEKVDYVALGARAAATDPEKAPA